MFFIIYFIIFLQLCFALFDASSLLPHRPQVYFLRQILKHIPAIIADRPRHGSDCGPFPVGRLALNQHTLLWAAEVDRRSSLFQLGTFDMLPQPGPNPDLGRPTSSLRASTAPGTISIIAIDGFGRRG